ncbi:amidase family protein, partial [Bordetella pertussis]
MLTIAALASAYRTRQTTPSATLRDLLDRIAASPLNSFISVDPETVMRQAADADAAFAGGAPAGALHGIPVAVKDLIDVAGMRTTMGSQQYANQASAERDAQVVARLRAEGAIIVGKTNTHEFAYGPTGDRSYFGAACNPRDPARMTGGSSSGSAAALGAGLCAAALGTDTSASIRLPAALCGV